MELITGIFAAFWWGLFLISFGKDRSRYWNCYLLFFAILGTLPLFLSFGGGMFFGLAVIAFVILLFGLLVAPFFLIHNGIVMIRKEGAHLAHMLSLGLGLAMLAGNAAFIVNVFQYTFSGSAEESVKVIHSAPFIALALFNATVVYGSMTFFIFMIYTMFLQIIPIKRDFDYVVIHGAGLVDGRTPSKLLQQRLDKAIRVYRRDPTPPKLIPSGGKGSDESISEAQAMKNYLLEQSIPEDDIIMEDQSGTTLENLKYSKEIIDSQPGRKYTALVTSNYHVYRALRYARQVGLKCTGIGSPVAFYYWPSALIREFIAIHAEKKHLIIFLAGWLITMTIVWVLFI